MIAHVKYLPHILLLAGGLALAGCGGSSDDGQQNPPTDPPKTPAEMASEAIAACTDADCVDKAIADAKKEDSGVTAAQIGSLEDEAEEKKGDIAQMATAEGQMKMLTDDLAALNEINATDAENIDALEAAIAKLRATIAGASEIEDTDSYTEAVNTAEKAANGHKQTADLEAKNTALTNALNAAEAAVPPTEAQIAAIETAHAALNTSIEAAIDVADTSTYKTAYDDAVQRLANVKGRKQIADDRKIEEENTIKAANAKNLFAAILGQNRGAAVMSGRVALSNDTDADDTTNITLRDDSIAPTITIPADKKTLAALSGWTGQRYFKAEPSGTDDGVFESHVYSKVTGPSDGKTFSETYNDATTLDTNNRIILASGFTVANTVNSSFDQDAGVKSFPEGTQKSITISGAYHGVTGTYTCTPTSGNVCAVSKVTDGFDLGLRALSSNIFTGGDDAWSFQPNNPNDKVKNAGGTALASFGWWIHQPAEDAEWSAGVFTQNRRPATDAAPIAPTGLNALLTSGTATYKGNVVGKYALYSTTGGTNDAGHFVADATLTADWEDDTLEGTINNFKGKDDKNRPWSVALKSSAIQDNGATATLASKTVWTIDGTKAPDSGSWNAHLWNNVDTGNETDNVPSVATGDFHTEYNSDGKMIGAFGADQQ